jgi:predicted permease
MLTVLLPLLAVAGAAHEHILFASDRVYTVLAVVLIVFFGFIGFLVYLERRVHDLEKKKKS